MNFKEKMELSKQAASLFEQLQSETLSLKERMQLSRERTETLERLGVGKEPEQQEQPEQESEAKKTRAKIGDGLENVEIKRHSANDIVITRETVRDPIVFYVKVDREKSIITIEDELHKSLGDKPRKIDYSDRYASFSNAVEEANDWIKDQLKTQDFGQRKMKAYDEEREGRSKQDVDNAYIAELERQRDTLVKAIDAYNGMVERDKADKLPTKNQEAAMRDAILDFGATARGYDGLGGLWRAGDVFEDRLKSVNEEIARVKGEAEPTPEVAEQNEPEIITQFKAGELVSLNAVQFKQAMNEVNDLGLDLEDIKAGAIAWFEFNKEAA